MKKRGVFELQVRWVFTLIVGAMVLIFFAGVVQKQVERGEFEESQRAASFISKAFTGGRRHHADKPAWQKKNSS